ncbi:MAG: transglycosylase domain-containing protein, partial [Verrucomicrobia bacterium]|nr:transglycosylase domain-containing protein [Cytophagales bacterium]
MQKFIQLENSSYRKIIKRIWIGFLIFLGVFWLYVGAVNINLFNLFGGMPDLKTLENPRSDLATEVYSSDGKMLGKFFSANRTPVDYDQVSPNVIKALIATEDVRFEEHSGVDLKATLSIPWYIITGKSKGGSTLSQQVAKNLFQTRDRRGMLYKIPGVKIAIIKTKEWITAIRIERNYTKREILMMYLNTVDFGSNSYGIHTASKTFFSTTPDKLTVAEAALLVGVLQNPSIHHPVRHPVDATRRRNTVLAQMLKYNYLSEAEFQALKAKPLGIRFNPETYVQGLAPHFRTYLKRELEPWAEEHNVNLYTDGLKIYTTIDSRMQDYAEQAVRSHMKSLQKTFDAQWRGKNPWIDDNGREVKDYIEKSARNSDRYRELQERFNGNEDSIKLVMNTPIKMKVFTWENASLEKDTLISPIDSIRYHKRFLHCGFMSMDPNTGDVKAWVGGTNFKHFQFDHVKQDRRQPGS